MPNSYFRFKQFTVHQQHCAMKVCTDACLFGAWVGEKIKSHPEKIKKILDIGTGTGLLSLMLAQQTDAEIDAVEIDEAAAGQAQDNFESSPWKNRLHVIRSDIRNTRLSTKYDLVISNPPFFENSLKSPDTTRNIALHSDMLALEQLITIAANNITDDGMFAVLLPFERKEECISIAVSRGLHATAITDVKQSAAHHFFRTMLCFTKKQAGLIYSEIPVKEGTNYNKAFILLLKSYYLNL